jgi:hypothetical protein
MVAERDEPITVLVTVAESNVVPITETVHEAEAIVQIVPKSRGRKPKVLNATENASQMGATTASKRCFNDFPHVTRRSRTISI